MKHVPFNVLVLCNWQFCRHRFFAEALFNHLGGGRFKAYSAGSQPSGTVNPVALETLDKHGAAPRRAASRGMSSPRRAPHGFHLYRLRLGGRRGLPDLAGPPDHGALGIADPAHVEPLAARREAFATAYRQFARRIGAFVTLPLETLSAQAISPPPPAVSRRAGMSASAVLPPNEAAGVSMGFFERYLSLWVVLCIVAGILLGQWFPAAFQALGRIEYAQVNLPVGLLIWVMIVPMLMKIDFASISEVKDQKAGIGITLFVNWAIKLFTMAPSAGCSSAMSFAPWLPAEQLDSYIAGLILLGAAPCTAMVFVWSNLCCGNANFTISQVALNDLVMVFAFALDRRLPAGCVGHSGAVGHLAAVGGDVHRHPAGHRPGLRKHFLRGGEQAFKQAAERIALFTIMALLATLVLLFAFRARPSSSSR